MDNECMKADRLAHAKATMVRVLSANVFPGQDLDLMIQTLTFRDVTAPEEGCPEKGYVEVGSPLLENPFRIWYTKGVRHAHGSMGLIRRMVFILIRNFHARMKLDRSTEKKVCANCGKFFARFRCNEPEDCDGCPKCQGMCECEK